MPIILYFIIYCIYTQSPPPLLSAPNAANNMCDSLRMCLSVSLRVCLTWYKKNINLGFGSVFLFEKRVFSLFFFVSQTLFFSIFLSKKRVFSIKKTLLSTKNAFLCVSLLLPPPLTPLFVCFTLFYFFTTTPLTPLVQNKKTNKQKFSKKRLCSTRLGVCVLCALRVMEIYVNCVKKKKLNR